MSSSSSICSGTPSLPKRIRMPLPGPHHLRRLRRRRARFVALRRDEALVVLVGHGVQRAGGRHGERPHVVHVEVVEHAGVAGAGDLVEQRLAAGAGVDGAVVGDRDRHHVRVVALVVDLRVAGLVDAEHLALGPRGRVERLVPGVEGEGPHVLGAGERGEHLGGAALGPRRAHLEHLPVRVRGGVHVAPPARDERGDHPRAGRGEELVLPPRDAEDLAVAAGAQQHGVADRQRAADRGGVGDGDRAEVEPGVHAAARVDAHAGEVAPLEVVERGELEAARADRARVGREEHGGGDEERAQGGHDAARTGGHQAVVHRCARGSRG